jgi:hypothetical protein
MTSRVNDDPSPADHMTGMHQLLHLCPALACRRVQADRHLQPGHPESPIGCSFSPPSAATLFLLLRLKMQPRRDCFWGPFSCSNYLYNNKTITYREWMMLFFCLCDVDSIVVVCKVIADGNESRGIWNDWVVVLFWLKFMLRLVIWLSYNWLSISSTNICWTKCIFMMYDIFCWIKFMHFYGELVIYVIFIGFGTLWNKCRDLVRPAPPSSLQCVPCVGFRRHR